ncbi:MAG: hypothetical protein LBL74_02455 [Bacteroidales bacterium]|nr:hypothetical protein [Bacteroidales bacterium]
MKGCFVLTKGCLIKMKSRNIFPKRRMPSIMRHIIAFIRHTALRKGENVVIY